MSDLTTYLTEGRHIFAICSECGEIHRLTDLKLSRKGRYARDWLDVLEDGRIRLENRQASLEERASSLQEAAKQRAERKVLPQLLRKNVPAIYRWGIDPRDVRTLIHPVDFVAFRGMNSPDGVREVALLNLGAQSTVTRSIKKAVSSGQVDWATLRLGDDGTVSTEGR